MSNPGFFFYTGDWLKDTRVLSADERGALIDLVCLASDKTKRWRLSWPLSGYRQVLGITLDDTEAILYKLKESGMCKIECRDGLIEADFRPFARRFTEAIAVSSWEVPYGWKKIRLVILERDSFLCRYCGDPANSVDHVTPKSRGGTEDHGNLVASCKTCNSKKNGRTPEEAGLVILGAVDAKN